MARTKHEACSRQSWKSKEDVAHAYAAKQVAAMACRQSDVPRAVSKYHTCTTEDLLDKAARLSGVAQEKQKTPEAQMKLDSAMVEVRFELEERERLKRSSEWLEASRAKRKESNKRRERERAATTSTTRSTGKHQLSAAQAAVESPSDHKHVRLSSTSRPWTDRRPKDRLEDVLRESKSAQKPYRSMGRPRERRASAALPGATAENAMELVSSDEEDAQQENPEKAERRRERGAREGRRLRRSPRVNAYRSLSQKLSGLKVVFPPSGTVHAVEINAEDLAHLETEEFLNDTVIDFYCKYLEETMVQSKDKERVHFFNAFFYKKLTQRPGSGSSLASAEGAQLNLNRRRHERVKKWTRNVDLFSKDYVFVPIHSAAHWSLAIICHPGASKSPTSDKWPCVLHLDSMMGGHSTNFVTKTLREYLEQEWICKMQPKIDAGEVVERKHFSPDAIPCKRVTTIPTQNNTWDCGLFLLSYIEHFLKDPPLAIRPDRLKELAQAGEHPHLFTKKWFPVQLPAMLRRRILTLILNIYSSQENLSNDKLLLLVEETLNDLLDAEEAESAKQAPRNRSSDHATEGGPGPSVAGMQPAASEAQEEDVGNGSASRETGEAARDVSEPEHVFTFGSQGVEKGNEDVDIIRSLEGRFAEKAAAAPAAVLDLLARISDGGTEPLGSPPSPVNLAEETERMVVPESLPPTAGDDFTAYRETKLAETQRKVQSIDRIMCNATLV